ncbi:MAG: EAL domain-containing protein [Pseudomonadota bacterium]|nr:EAL domain-containing protein [Pseudomonadota bacterium]MDP1573177.1 EAL domain-containing protein [Pseudomonadota bacterium]MDP1904252.1 EAL domain-containing protein [Pseudomonadota bacterium]
MRLKTKIWILLGALMSMVLVIDLSISFRKLAAELRKETEIDARAIYGYMMATRRVYQQVFVDSGLPVNDHTVGLLPAHSFSRISTDFANWNDSGILFNNVSDHPRNPSNRADRFELEDITWFRGNAKATERVRDIVDDKGVGYLLYTAPIWIEPSCLICHGEREAAPDSIRSHYNKAYDYQVGDLRGVVSIKMPTKRLDTRRNDVWAGQLVKSLLSYAILFLALGLLLDRLVTRRLARLQASAEHFAAGDYGVRMDKTGEDEICRLSDAFNQMADAVETREHALQQEISEKERGAAEIHRLAFFDGVTGLPNRVLLVDRLKQQLASGRRSGLQEALILINIDRFKTINDARGHNFGDALLRELAARLSGLLRDGDTLARLTADEFALMLPDLGQHMHQVSRRALVVAEKIHAALHDALQIEDEGVIITASLGIAMFSEEPDETPEDILRRADTALHRAKAAGGNQSAFFERGMGESAEQRFRIERELRNAIPAGELRLYLQPQVDAEGKLVGAEVLVRWQHPTRGLLPPGVFIPVAEESDLIVDLGAWVLTETCTLMAREDMAGHPLHLSVNMSPRHFRRNGFVVWVRDLLAASGADPGHLTLEVTEGLMIDNLGEVVAKMEELARLGIHFSVDDFGTGYSSLAYLKRLPIHELKIDKTFVQDAPSDPDDAALVETILSVARHMHLKVVAEGVETEEQADFLNARGTVIHQGYLYGRPEPAETWISRWRQASANR